MSYGLLCGLGGFIPFLGFCTMGIRSFQVFQISDFPGQAVRNKGDGATPCPSMGLYTWWLLHKSHTSCLIHMYLLQIFAFGKGIGRHSEVLQNNLGAEGKWGPICWVILQKPASARSSVGQGQDLGVWGFKHGWQESHYLNHHYSLLGKLESGTRAGVQM